MINNTDKPPITTANSRDWFKASLKLTITSKSTNAGNHIIERGKGKQIRRCWTDYTITTEFHSTKEDEVTKDKAPDSKLISKQEFLDDINTAPMGSYICFYSYDMGHVITDQENTISANANCRKYMPDGTPGYHLNGIIQSMAIPIFRLTGIDSGALEWFKNKDKKYDLQNNYWTGYINIKMFNYRGKGFIDKAISKYLDWNADLPIPIRIPFAGDRGTFKDTVTLTYFVPVLRVLSHQWEIKLYGSTRTGKNTLYFKENYGRKTWIGLAVVFTATAVIANALCGGTATPVVIGLVAGLLAWYGTGDCGKYQDKHEWEKPSYRKQRHYRYTVNEV